MEILAQWAFAKNYLESGSDVAISVILLIPTKIIINQNMSLETYKEKKTNVYRKQDIHSEWVERELEENGWKKLTWEWLISKNLEREEGNDGAMSGI